MGHYEDRPQFENLVVDGSSTVYRATVLYVLYVIRTTFISSAYFTAYNPKFPFFSLKPDVLQKKRTTSKFKICYPKLP